MADCEGSCTGSCSNTCQDSCKDSCKDGCKGTCKDTCSNTCLESCKDGCKGTCKDTCKGGCKGTCLEGCTNDCKQACLTTCNSECKGNCYEKCNTTCYTTCTGECKGYCASICQTYCETAQTFIENIAPTAANPVGSPSFAWTNPVSQNATIKITASDWNTLKSYIIAAVPYCGGTAPTSNDVSSNDIITASLYNDLANGLNLTKVTANTSIITASVINSLRDTYQARKILSNLPTRANDSEQNKCCQSGETCMAEDQFLAHQGKTTTCANQAESTCGNQNSGDS